MLKRETELEQRFQVTSRIGGSGCPLPEPSHDDQVIIEHPDHLEIHTQPTVHSIDSPFSYDDPQNMSDKNDQLASWKELFMDHLLSDEDLGKLVALNLLSPELARSWHQQRKNGN